MIDLTDGEARALSYLGRVNESPDTAPYWKSRKGVAESLSRKKLISWVSGFYLLTDAGKLAIGAME